MTPRKRLLSRCVLCLLLALAVPRYCPAQDTSAQDTVARIAGQYSITVADLKTYFHDHHYAYMYRKHPAMGFEKALNGMIVDQLKRMEFFAAGFQKDGNLIQRIRRPVNEEAAIRYYTTQFYEHYVNDEALRNAYKEMGREVYFQQIVLAKPRNGSRKEVDSLRSLANAIRKRLESGEDAARLAKQFSRDQDGRPATAMQLMDWKMSFSSDASYTVYRLPAGAVRILETSDSFLVVRVANVTTKGVQPFADVKEEIRKTLDGRFASISYAEFEREKKGLLDEKGAKWNPEALRQLVNWSRIPKFYQTSYADTLREAISRGRNFVILECSKVRVDLTEYLRLLNDVLMWGDQARPGPDDVKKYVLEAVRTSLIVDRAVRLGLEKDVLTPWTKNPLLKTEIVRLYDRHEIEERIPPASDRALREFYMATKDSLYYQPAKVNILAVAGPERNLIQGLREQLHQGVPFDKLAREVLVKTYIRKRDGSLETYLGDEPPFLAETAFSLKLNEVGGPVEYVDPVKGKLYALIKCVAIRDAKQLSYDDVGKSIANDYANYHRVRIGRDVEERLRRKYAVTISTDVLKRNLSSVGITPD